MAGSPERPSNQPLTKEARDKIGSFYSSKPALDKEGKRLDFPLVQMLHDFWEAKTIIEKRASVSIPSSTVISLARDLGFHRLQWQIINNSDMSLFMTGNEVQTNHVNINRALGIIEITYRPNTTHRKGNERFIPSDLRISGINREQNKIVAARWDPEDQNRLIEFNVSLGKNEVFRTSPSINIPRLLSLLPSSTKEPYKTAGFVTKEMVNTINKRNNPEIDDVEELYPFIEAAIFSKTSDGFSLGKNLMYVDTERLSEYIYELGYYMKQADGIVTVGLTKEAAEKRKTLPWEISLPEVLPKA